MAVDMHKTNGTSRDLSLLAGGRAETIGIAVKPGSGVLEHGTVLQKEASGLYIPATTGTLANGALVILARDEDTGLEATGTAPSTIGYESGRFIHQKVKLKSGSLTAADYLEMRRQGLVTDGMGEGLNNEVGGP